MVSAPFPPSIRSLPNPLSRKSFPFPPSMTTLPTIGLPITPPRNPPMSGVIVSFPFPPNRAAFGDAARLPSAFRLFSDRSRVIVSSPPRAFTVIVFTASRVGLPNVARMATSWPPSNTRSWPLASAETTMSLAVLSPVTTRLSVLNAANVAGTRRSSRLSTAVRIWERRLGDISVNSG